MRLRSFSKKRPRGSLDNTVKKIKIESLNVEVMVQQALECRERLKYLSALAGSESVDCCLDDCVIFDTIKKDKWRQMC